MGANNNQVLGEQFYQIQIQLTAATGASATTTPAEQIGSFPFRWEELGADWDDSNGDWDIRISDTGGNRFFSPHQIKVKALVGLEKQPYELKHPYVFAWGSGIMVEAKNNGSATDTLTLVFVGARLPREV